MPERLKALIRDIPDFPKPGIVFKDITTLLADGPAFAHAIDLLAERYQNRGIDRVVAMEARGFILGAPLAVRLGAGFVPVRKKGKLPHATIEETYALEYGKDTLQMHQDALIKGHRVLVVDDVLATGGTAAAVARLVGQLDAEIVEAAFLMELTFLHGREKLNGITTYALIEY
ncbi:MAG TPA: adenine phosphoribosyltransferase [bacterium]|jgi:adenine phosphoribosyltransferase|nr:adenine phosphoribosyltransferase [bacterium]HXC64780.1 adenine phosphoribosyltransferase [bacterium]